MNRPIKIIEPEKVWEKVQTRIKKKQVYYDRYLKGSAELGSSENEESENNAFYCEEEEEEEESESVSVIEQKPHIITRNLAKL